MSDSYSSTEPYDRGKLDVGDGHALYWEIAGNPNGLPAVWLHGGPGSGSNPDDRRHFDPATYRVVLFDQRGCGRSRPLASDIDADLTTNTTDHLIGDLVRLREHLGITGWVVAGISWGVTLALAYAQRHPDQVLALVLAAVTTGTRRETDWITREMGRVFPREWDRFLQLVPEPERHGDLAAAYSRLLTNPDPDVREAAALAWCRWEDTHVSLAPDWAPSRRYESAAFRMVFARLVTQYWSHGCFLADSQLLTGMARLATTPGVLIHGRRDVSGPLDSAWTLHQSWPGSRLVVLEAGHGGGTFPDELKKALDGSRELHQRSSR